LRKFILNLEQEKPVILCGDLNVAHQNIDIARPKSNYNKSAGFTQKEIDGLSALLDEGFIDVWRSQHPDEVKYSWWSYRFGARKKNIGWRIDYFIASEKIADKIKRSSIMNDIMGSDHCPVAIELDL
jgi:exodeoxyribonuclease-3